MTLQRTPIHITEAVARVIDNTKHTDVEMVDYLESYGRHLAEDLYASDDLPMFNKSAMDGFAIRSEDSIGASGENRIAFKVVEEIPAGHSSDYKLKKNEAFRIMTGAELPASADAVVMFEQSKAVDETSFTVRKTFEPFDNIAKRGEEVKSGELIVPKGTMINPGVIANLATFGHSKVRVHKLPKVAVMSTGSELLDVDEQVTRGKIRNSNTPMIISQLKRIGIDAKVYRFKTDDLDEILEIFKEMIAEVDVVITTGGVSVGDYDLLPKVYEYFNADVLFNKVAMRPGSVTTVAKLNDILLFGLSGNPSACYSGFELFVRPSILQMLGSNNIYAPFIEATLDEDFKKANPFTRFIRAELRYTGGALYASPSGFNKSNAVTSIAKSNGVIVLPSGSRGFTRGDKVTVMMTDMTSGTNTFLLNEDD